MKQWEPTKYPELDNLARDIAYNVVAPYINKHAPKLEPLAQLTAGRNWEMFAHLLTAHEMQMLEYGRKQAHAGNESDHDFAVRVVGGRLFG